MGCRWRRIACGFWWSGHHDCDLERDRQAHQAPFFPCARRGSVARTAVESIIQVCKSIKPCSFNLRCKRLSIWSNVP